MKIKILVLIVVLFSVVFLTYLYAQETIEISGAQIPLFEGALSVKKAEAPTVSGRILTYTVDKPFDEVTKFYKSFLAENNFLLIG